MSLIYPIEIFEPQSVWNKTQTRKQILMIGMVRQDISSIFRVLNLSKDPNYALMLSAQTFVVIVIIFIITLHYGAVLKYQVDIPLAQLTDFLLQNTEQSKQQIRNDEKTKKFLLNQFASPLLKSMSITQQSKKKLNLKDQNLSSIYTQEKLLNNYNIEQKQNYQDSFDKSQNFKKSASFVKKPSLRQKVMSNNLQKDRLQNKDQLDSFFSNITREKTETMYLQNNKNKSKEALTVLLDQNNNIKVDQQVDSIDDSIQIGKEAITNSTSVSILNSKSNYLKNSNHQIINIEEDIEPMFQEMQVIKDTFHKLSGVIAYKKNNVKYNESMNNNDDAVDIGKCILHYAFAAKIFKQIKNNFGLAISCLNLGYYCQKKSDYTEAIIHYQAALHHTLIDLGYQSLNQFSDSLNQGKVKQISFNEQTKELMTILCISLILQAHAIKEVIFDRRDLYRNKQVKCDFLKNEARRSRWINLAIYYIELVKKFMTQTNKSGIFILQNDTMLLVESEYIEMKMERESHVNVEILLNRFEDQFFLVKGNYQCNQIEVSMTQSQYQTVNFQSSQKKMNKQDEIIEQQEDKNKSKIIIILLEARIEYLKGIFQQRQKNFKSSCIHFTQCLEQYQYLEISLQKKIIENLGIIFVDNGISIYNIYSEYNYLKQKLGKKVYDIAISVEGSVGISDTFANHITNCLLRMYSKFISKSDKTTFIAFQNQEIRIIQPLLPIDKIKQWRFCIEQIPKISTTLTQEELSIRSKGDSIFMASPIHHSQSFGGFQQQFAELQQKLENKNKKQKHEVRQSIFIIFTNTPESNNSFTQNIKMLIANLKGQFPSTPQIIHVQLQQSQSIDEYDRTLKGIQSDSPYIIMSELQQLEYYLNFHKRSDNSQHFLTNLILTQSSL